MDPLSLTLAVITFATAVKDIVELAHKIHGSFAKVSTNLLKAQAAANEIKNTLDDLDSFCSRHYDILEHASDLRISLQDLIAKMKAFEVDIIPLIPRTMHSKKSRLMHGFSSWKNHRKIEASITELRSSVEKTIASFMMRGLLRVEAKLEKMHQTTDRGLQIIHREVTHIRTMRTALSSLNGEFNAITEAGEELVSSACIAFQISHIFALLQELPLDYITKTNPEPFSLPPVVIRLYSPLQFVDVPSLNRRIISWVSQIRRTLEMKATTDSLYKVSLILDHLAIGLSLLRMRHEAATSSKLSVKLCRMLSLVDRGVSALHLVHRLRNLSVHAWDSNDNQTSLEAIEEAWTISTGIQSAETSLDDRIIHSRILSNYASLISILRLDHARSVSLSKQSVGLMEDILLRLGIPCLPFNTVDTKGLPGLCQATQQDTRNPPIVLALGTYARALRQLSICLSAVGSLNDAFDAKQHAAIVLYTLRTNYGTTVDLELANILYELVTDKGRPPLHRAISLFYVEECVRLYREYAQKKPSEFGRRLCHALFEKATALDSLGRHEYSTDTWRELALVAQQISRDDALYVSAINRLRLVGSAPFRGVDRNQWTSASIPMSPSPSSGTTAVEAERLFDSYLDLLHAQRYSEAEKAAYKSVERYRVLAYEKPQLWTGQLGKGLTELAHSHWFLGDRDGAYSLGSQALDLFQSHSKELPSILGDYYYALQINLKIAYIIDDESKAIARCAVVLQHARRLLSDHPRNVDVGSILIRAQYVYGNTLIRVNRPVDADEFYQNLIDEWEEKPPFAVQANFEAYQMQVLVVHAQVLDGQGNTMLALSMLQRAEDISNAYPDSDITFTEQRISARYSQVILMTSLGRCSKALKLAEETVTFARALSNDSNIDNLIWTLLAVAKAADGSGCHERALEAAQEALTLCQTDKKLSTVEGPVQNGSSGTATCMCCSLQLVSLAEGNLGRIDPALFHANQAVESVTKLNSVWFPSSYYNEMYIETRGHLAKVLLAAGDTEAARHLLEERREYLRNRVKERNGEYRDLAPTLHILGIIYCSEGDHGKGSAVAQELHQLLDRLAGVFSSLHSQVLGRLSSEFMAPVSQAARGLLENLNCDHQRVFAPFDRINKVEA